MLSKILQSAEALVKIVGEQHEGVRLMAPKLIQLLRDREAKGLQTYGQTLDTAEGYDWPQMIQEELADGLMYMAKYAALHGIDKISSEAALLVLIMATIEGGLRGSNQGPDAIRGEDSGGTVRDERSRIIIPG